MNPETRFSNAPPIPVRCAICALSVFGVYFLGFGVPITLTAMNADVSLEGWFFCIQAAISIWLARSLARGKYAALQLGRIYGVLGFLGGLYYTIHRFVWSLNFGFDNTYVEFAFLAFQDGTFLLIIVCLALPTTRAWFAQSRHRSSVSAPDEPET